MVVVWVGSKRMEVRGWLGEVPGFQTMTVVVVTAMGEGENG
jgi:hypothetical protein